MKKAFQFLLVAVCIAPLTGAWGAIQIKKASPVATQPAAGTDGAASLVPTVLGLVTNVMDLNARQKALTAECIPTTAEINFINNTMKEWAKTGQSTADQLARALNRRRCADSENGYATDVRTMGTTSGIEPCFNSFAGAGNRGMVWENFPKAGKGTYCKSGAYSCSGNDVVTLSDAYDIFYMIDFTPADYIPSEATMAARLMNKLESCSSIKVNAKKKEMWGDFLINTAGGLGQKTNTGSIMEQVGTITSSGGGMGALGSLGAIATQYMDK